MSLILNNFKICRQIPENIKKRIKSFYVFNDWSSGSNVLLITFDEKLFGSGSNDWGVLGLGHNDEVKEVTEIPELSENNIKEFYNGMNFVFAINGERNVLFGWGNNFSAQLG